LALGNPTVDLFSLDIEGGELPVLRSIPWDKVDIKVIIIEVNYLGKIFEAANDDLVKLMTDNGYKFFSEIHINHVYVKNDFVPERLKSNFKPFLEIEK
jgi:hypothetical protein